jgi:hypothetical protein
VSRNLEKYAVFDKTRFFPKRKNWQLGKYLIYILSTELYRMHHSNVLHIHFYFFRFFTSNGTIPAQFTQMLHKNSSVAEKSRNRNMDYSLSQKSDGDKTIVLDLTSQYWRQLCRYTINSGLAVQCNFVPHTSWYILILIPFFVLFLSPCFRANSFCFLVLGHWKQNFSKMLTFISRLV